jgi:DNA-binding CsgD family transcriptional regulator/tetratricopeptide (TPR) repeat protein
MTFPGREAELELLDEVGRRVLAGEPSAVVIEGDGGIGKSTLVNRAAERWQTHGLEIWTTAIPRSGAFALDDLLPDPGTVRAAPPPAHHDDTAVTIVELPRGSTGPGTAVNRVLDAIDSRPVACPLAIIVEDAHWAEASTAQDLASFASRLGGRAVLLVVTARPAPRDPDVDVLIATTASVGATRIRLAPLSDSDVADVVRDRLGAEPGPGLLQLLDGAGGNPLLLDEAMRTLDSEQLLHRDASQSGVATVDVSDAVTAADGLPPLRIGVLRRSSLVDDVSIDLLRHAAVLGQRFRVDDLSILTERSVRDLTPSLLALSRSGLVVDDGDRLAFRHDLVHDALYRDIPQVLRNALHREAAQVLHGAGASAEQVAVHLQVAASAEPALIDLTFDVSGVLLGRSPALARRLLLALLEVLPGSHDRRPAALAAVAAAAAQTGDLAVAREYAAAALEHDADVASHHLARMALVSVSVSTGAMAQAVADLQAASALPGLPADDRLRSDALRSYYRIWAFDLAGARSEANAILDELGSGQRAVSTRASKEGEARAHEVLALVDLADGHAADALDHARLAHAALGRSVAARPGESLVHQALGLALVDNDRIDEAITAVGVGQRLAEETGTRGAQVFYATSASMMNVVRGRLDDALALSDTALVILGDAEINPVAGLPHAVRARVALARGDIEAATEAMDRAATAFASAGPVLGGLAFLTWLGEVHHAAGRHEAAHDTLVLAWQLGSPARYLIVWKNLAVALARLSVDRPLDTALALDVRAAVAEGARRGSTQSATAVLHRVEGLLDGDPDRLMNAVACLRLTERSLDLAECLIDTARCLERTRSDSGASAEVDALLAEASDVATRIGATGLVEAAALRSGRRRTRPARSVPRPTFGWESLTPTENLVAELTAQGLTNPQIGEQLGMSRRTAETHLSHVFVKLGITNRAQLAAEIGRRSG